MLKLLVGPDVHLPFHDRKALAAFDVLEPDHVLFLGDVADLSRMSKTAPERAALYYEEIEDVQLHPD